MPDQAMGALPRIALVFGDEAAVAHVREAMVDHADIVYAAPAAEFDASRQLSAGATAALVNLDGGDWLDDVETKLHAAGIAVVYNDPEISQSLEGWERARWLRHLVAKLRGSRDVDPPRPENLSLPVPMAQVETVAPVVALAASPASAVVERPLSPEEIETMTVDFGAESKSAPVYDDEVLSPAVADTAVDIGVLSPEPPEPVAVAEPSVAFEPTPQRPDETTLVTATPPEAAPSQTAAEPVALDFDAESSLDVDTEALSAMIDARLAEPGASEPSGSPEVWREVSGNAVSRAQPDDGIAAEKAQQPDVAPAIMPVAAVNDDADVLASLPPLDDWALVDPDAVHVPATGGNARKSPEPVLSDAFAGLELVPMETIAPLRADADPPESWFAGGVGKPKAVANGPVRSGIKEAIHEHG